MVEFPTDLSIGSGEILVPEAPENRFQPLTFAKHYERQKLWSEVEQRTPSYLNTALKILLTIPLFLFENITLTTQTLGNTGVSLGNYLFPKRSVSVVTPATIDKRSNQAELNAAFIVAVEKHDSNKVQALIQAGADVNTPICYTWTEGDCDWDVETSALMYAVRKNWLDMVKVLLKTEKNLNSAFGEAIRRGCLGIVEELIKGGADINDVDEVGCNTPLMIAIQHQKSLIIQALLKAGAHVNHVNKYGETALMNAVINHDFNTVKNLLQVPEMTAGSFFGFGTKPINYANKDGDTALILAIKNVRCSYSNQREHTVCVNSQNIIKELLATPGIDPYHVNKNGETAIELLEKLK